MKKRPPDQTPWMDPPAYGRTLRPGIGFNLLVRDMERAVRFATEALGATVTYVDEDFAALRLAGAEWMLHADHTYSDNALAGIIKDVEARGAGVELRLYGVDPDEVEAHAREGGWTVLAGAIDKPHGLREAVIIDDEGYVWVPGIALKS